MVVIGLIGGIAAGKSTAAAALQTLGCEVYDADRAVHRLLGTERVLTQLHAWWGDGVVGEDGRVRRPAVGRVVFGNTAELARLQRLLHPMVCKEVRTRIMATRDQRTAGRRPCAFVIDAPLLVEAGLVSDCDGVWTVEAHRAIRVARARARGWDEEELQRREAVQRTDAQRAAIADTVIVNQGDQRALRLQLGQALAERLESGMAE